MPSRLEGETKQLQVLMEPVWSNGASHEGGVCCLFIHVPRPIGARRPPAPSPMTNPPNVRRSMPEIPSNQRVLESRQRFVRR